jgi:hypothetical protein
MRRRQVDKKPAVAIKACRHPLVALVPGTPATWRLCDPRLVLWPDALAPTAAKAAAKARRDHWPLNFDNSNMTTIHERSGRSGYDL